MISFLDLPNTSVASKVPSVAVVDPPITVIAFRSPGAVTKAEETAEVAPRDAPTMDLFFFPFLACRYDFSSALCFSFSRSEEHTSELQSLTNLVCRLLLEKKNDVVEFYISLSFTPTPVSDGFVYRTLLNGPL